MKRRFIDAPAEDRCAWTVKLKDASEAQCGRRKTVGDLCTQHHKMRAAMEFQCCEGNNAVSSAEQGGSTA